MDSSFPKARSLHNSSVMNGVNGWRSNKISRRQKILDSKAGLLLGFILHSVFRVFNVPIAEIVPEELIDGM